MMMMMITQVELSKMMIIQVELSNMIIIQVELSNMYRTMEGTHYNSPEKAIQVH